MRTIILKPEAYMAKLTIYGTPASRTFRTLWMAKELGLEHEHVPVDFRKGDTKKEEYRRLNPNERIPTIQDGDLVLWESMAINLYLAKKHGGPLAPKNLAEEALATQWSMWGLTEAEPDIVNVLRNRFMLPEAQRDEASAKRSEDALKKPMAVLEGALAKRDWLVGDRCTVADINLAGIVSTVHRIKLDLAPYPKVAAWLKRCLDRPAAVAALKQREEAMKALAA